MAKIELGDEVKDVVTGFKGIAVGITTWLNGCRRVTVQPAGIAKDGKLYESNCFDEPQLQVLKSGKVVIELAAEPAHRRTGGPIPPPQRGQNISR